MHEFFKDAFYISGTICFVTITISLVKSLRVLKFLFSTSGASPTEMVPVAPLPTGVIEQNDSVFDVPESEAPPVANIECGKCHREIMTAPVSVEGKPPFEKLIFRCEHCGTDVAIPA